MKTSFIFLFLFLLPLVSFAQTNPVNDTVRDIKPDTGKFVCVMPAEKMPEFPGGQAAFKHYLEKNLSYPIAEKEMGIEGTVYISFFVETDGSITNISVKKEVPGAPGFSKEGIRVISMMPSWTPGELSGKPVRVNFVQPIKFVLDGIGIRKPILTYGVQVPEGNFQPLEKYTAAVLPSFPGGNDAMQRYVREHFHSDSINTNKHSTFILIDFIVDSTGKICNVKMGDYYYYKLWPADSAAMRMIAYMPEWKPGEKDGKPCAVEMMLRIPTVYSHDPDAPVIPVVKIKSEPMHLVSTCGPQVAYAPGKVVSQFAHRRDPEFRGSWDSLIVYTDSAFEAFNRRMGYTCTGSIHISFVVDRKGRVVNVQLMEGLSEPYAAFNEEAMRIACTMPRWKPGRKNFRRRNMEMYFILTPDNSL